MKSNAQRALESLRAEREEHAESVDTLRASLVGLRAVNDPTAEQERECAEVVARLATAERNLAGANTAIRVLEPVLADLQDAAIRIEGGIDRRTLDDRAGFTHFGEFVGAVANAARYRDRAVDERLMMPRAATGASEAVGADGGFLVPTAFSSEIARLSMSDTNYTTFCRTTPVTGNSMTFNSKNTTPWGASGLKAYWEGEGAPGQPTQPKFSRVTMTLNKLLGIAAVTNEMLADTTALEAELKQEFAEAVLWKTNSAVWEGTGAGMPEGILNAACTVEYTRETSSTVTPKDITEMKNRVIGIGSPRNVELSDGSRTTSLRWLIHFTAMGTIERMVLGDQPVFQPPGYFADAPNGTLFGIPIIIAETASELGTKGDVALCNFRHYRVLRNRQALQFADSMHVYFNTDEHAFRVTFRMDGTPWMEAPIAPAKGSVQRSPFLVLK